MRKNSGPKFGNGCDTFIPDKCLSKISGYTYTYTYKTEEKCEINGGEARFYVEDYEVFLVKYK